MKSLPSEFLAWRSWLVLNRSRLLEDIVRDEGVGSSIPSQRTCLIGLLWNVKIFEIKRPT